MLLVVYTERNGGIRLISARKADRDDERDYYKARPGTSVIEGTLPRGGTCLSRFRDDWARLEAMTDEEALQNALDDPDSQPLA